MAFIIKDRIKEGTTTTGTGDISLGGAAATFEPFGSYMVNGDTTYYAIVHTESGIDEWEVGLGTYDSTNNAITRTTILSGSAGTSAVNFSAGTKDVFMTYPASHAALAYDDVTFDNISVTGTVDGRDVAADGAKLDTVETNADVTDAVNVAAAGALMKSGGTMTGDLILNGDPTVALGAATKEYVDTIAAAGIHYHTPVRVETPSALTATYDNGASGVGATLTNSGTQATLTIDGVTVALNDRVLVYKQANAAHNGIYTVTDTGSASTNWVLTRAVDADSYGASDPDAMGEGDAYFVKEGDTGAGELYVMNTSGVITFGTTPITFTVIAETAVYSAGTGISLDGTTFSIGQDVATTANVTFNQVVATIIGNVTGNLTGNVTGNADTATALETARTIQLTGDVIGSATFDGTANAVITASVQDDSHAHVISNVDGLQAALDAKADDTTTISAGTGLTGGGSIGVNRTISLDTSYTDGRYVNVTGDTMTGDLSFGDNWIYMQYTGSDLLRMNAAGDRFDFYNQTQSRFTDVRARSFVRSDGNVVFHDGYHPNADKWTTARTLSLSGDASGSVSWDGSGNATLSVTVANDSHSHSNYTPLDHMRSTGNGYHTSTTTSALLSEVLGDGAFDSYFSTHKTGWSYAGNGDLTDAGRLTELAGTAWAWWTDNAGDGTQGNVTGLVIAPNTGGSAGKVFIYNNQGSGYSPGWREVWTSTSDGSGSGLDADLLDGIHASSFLRSDADDSYSHTITGNKLYLGGGAIVSSSAALQVNGFMRTGNVIIHEGGGTPTSADGTLSNNAGSLEWKTNKIWHAGNDGSGSGLDADLLDGQHASSFIRSNANDTYTGTMTVNGTIQFSTSYNEAMIRHGASGPYLRSDGNYLVIEQGDNISAPLYARGFTTFDLDCGISYNDVSRYWLSTSSNWGIYWNTGSNQIEFRGAGTNRASIDLDDGTVRATNFRAANAFYLGESNSYLNSTDNGWYSNVRIQSAVDLKAPTVRIGSEVVLQESSDRADLLQITSSTSGWGGLQIRNSSNEGRWSFMTDGEYAGIYNDEDNQWHIYMQEGGYTQLRYASSTKLQTSSSGVSVTGSITASGNITAYSDERLKTNVHTITGALDKVKALRGVSYTKEGSDSIGVIAQEVEKVIPEVVEDGEEYKSVAYGNMVGLLIEAIKEQQQQIDELKARLEQ